MKKLILIAAISTMALGGCVATMTAAPAGPYALKNGTSVNLDKSWTHIPENLHPSIGSVLTQDGMSLNRVHILTVEDGEEMIGFIDKAQEYPVYTAGSTQLQQIEFMTSSLSRLGLESVNTENVKPATLGGIDGVSMDLSGKYSSGLHMKGRAAIAPSSAGLNMVIYLAPKMHYYNKDIGSVEAIISSIQFAAE